MTKKYANLRSEAQGFLTDCLPSHPGGTTMTAETIAAFDAAVRRHGMGTVEMDATTWAGVIDHINTLRRDLDGARNLIARAEIAMRERRIAHDTSKARADELAAQVERLADTLRGVLYGVPDPESDGYRAAAGLIHTTTATTRTTR